MENGIDATYKSILGCVPLIPKYSIIIPYKRRNPVNCNTAYENEDYYAK